MTMSFTEITAVFTQYANNFRILHWCAVGKKFDRIHNTAKEYYEMIGDDLDVLAEMGMRVNQSPSTMYKAASILSNISDHNFLVIENCDLVDFEKFCKMTNLMLMDICYSIESVLSSDIMKDPRNVGIRATLEGIHDKYDLQARYLNARRFADDD